MIRNACPLKPPPIFLVGKRQEFGSGMGSGRVSLLGNFETPDFKLGLEISCPLPTPRLGT